MTRRAESCWQHTGGSSASRLLSRRLRRAAAQRPGPLASRLKSGPDSVRPSPVCRPDSVRPSPVRRPDSVRPSPVCRPRRGGDPGGLSQAAVRRGSSS